jgi:DNA (cytosine-5)-methyltransferase 1
MAMMLNELSLFSGYGGFSLGLRLAGIQTRTVMYVEWERYPQEILKARIKDGLLDDAPIWADISTLDGRQFRGLVDIITGGFPCQPHSVAGQQRGVDDERNLWPDTLRVIRAVGPRYVILENVPGLISASADGGRPAYGGTVVGELASLGYSVHWQTIGADDVGAPHRRKRWWCIGVADSQGQRAVSGGGGNEGVSGSRVQATNPSVRQGREARIEERVWQDGPGDIRYNANNGSDSSDGELADSLHDGPYRETGDEAKPGGNEPHDRVLERGDCATGRGVGDLPTWPPGPSDTDGWERVLRERPDLAPALSKEAECEHGLLVNGRSHRVDELKALGNGIVPSVVAEFLRRVM